MNKYVELDASIAKLRTAFENSRQASETLQSCSDETFLQPIVAAALDKAVSDGEIVMRSEVKTLMVGMLEQALYPLAETFEQRMLAFEKRCFDAG